MSHQPLLKSSDATGTILLKLKYGLIWRQKQILMAKAVGKLKAVVTAEERWRGRPFCCESELASEIVSVMSWLGVMASYQTLRII